MSSKKIQLAAEKRDKAGKGVSRALRRKGRIPAVVYGDHKEPFLCALPEKDVNVEYYRGHMFTRLTELNLEGEKFSVLARDVQLDPVNDFVLHVDFLRITPKTKIHVKVPVHFINEEECPGMQQKGVLNVVRYEVEVVCPATDIPESLEADLSGLEIGDSLKSDNIELPKGAVFAIQDREFTLANILAPRRIVDETEGEEAEGEEIEVEGEEAEGAEEASEAEGEEQAEEASE